MSRSFAEASVFRWGRHSCLPGQQECLPHNGADLLRKAPDGYLAGANPPRENALLRDRLIFQHEGLIAEVRGDLQVTIKARLLNAVIWREPLELGHRQ